MEHSYGFSVKDDMENSPKARAPHLPYGRVALACAAIVILFWLFKLNQQIATLTQERLALMSNRQEAQTKVQALEQTVAMLSKEEESRKALASFQGESTEELGSIVKRLDEQVKNLVRLANQRRRRGEVAEFDPTEASSADASGQESTNSVPLRGWGPEQAVGPPNTQRAGDIQTAWASREPDGGSEWLWLQFPSATDLAEVRIRETYNPGAITQVTAMVDGQQIVLWEGKSNIGEAPRDFVVPVTGDIRAQSVVVHLDTSLVPGWNEIDAVELVGRDGSRQWASSANASTTYAER